MRFLVLFIALAACNTGSVSFWGVEPTRVTVKGYVFDVRVKNNAAEAVRMNRLKLRDRRMIFQYGAQAMEIVSGCEVLTATLTNDPTLMQAGLKC